jgi:DNA-binding NtrC family response regulator
LLTTRPAYARAWPEVLRDAGYAVDTAVDGSAALAALDERDFAVVITDLRMPGADGLTVLRKLREVAPQTLAIVMTAHGSVESAVEALRRAADALGLSLSSLYRKMNELGLPLD